MAFDAAAVTRYAWTSPLRTTDEAAIIQFKNDAEQACCLVAPLPAGRSYSRGQAGLDVSRLGGRPKVLRKRRIRRITKRSSTTTMSAESPHSG
jgi:hypothetical protein